MTNKDVVAIDISGMQLSQLGARVPPGTVLVPGQSAVFGTQKKPTGVSGGNTMNIWVTSSKD
jgi:hypothetical protein